MEIIDGSFINAGNINLYVKILGSGNPPIVIEPAIGGLSVEWYHLQKEIARHTTVVTYDRAGYGESPTSKIPRLSKNIVNELFTMLFNSEVEHPYIFIGHLEGALYVQHFAKLFPAYVAGLILLDSPFPAYWELESGNFPEYYRIASLNTRMENLRKVVEGERKEFPQKITPLLEELYKEFPDELRIPLITYQSDKKFYETVISEFEMLEKSINDVFEGGNFPDLPVSIVSHSYHVMHSLSMQLGIPRDEALAIENFWLEGEKNLLSLYPQGKFYIVENSDKNFHYSNPSSVYELALEMLGNVSRLG